MKLPPRLVSSSLRDHGIADLLAGLVLGIAALVAQHQAGHGAFLSNGGGEDLVLSVGLGPVLVFLLWSLTAAVVVRGLALVISSNTEER